MTHGGFLAWQGVGGEPYSNCADRNRILDMRSISSYLFVACLFLVESSPSSAAVPPKFIGMCVDSFIESKRFRMVATPGDPDYI